MVICVLQSFVSVSLLSPVDPTPVIKLIKMIGTQTRSLDNKQPFNDSTVQFRIRIRLKILQDGLDCDWKLSRVDAVYACQHHNGLGLGTLDTHLSRVPMPNTCPQNVT